MRLLLILAAVLAVGACAPPAEPSPSRRTTCTIPGRMERDSRTNTGLCPGYTFDPNAPTEVRPVPPSPTSPYVLDDVLRPSPEETS